MADENQVDVQPLSDEDFLKMSPEQYQAYTSGEAASGEDTVQGGVSNEDSQAAGDDGQALEQGEDSQTGGGEDSQPAAQGDDSVPGQQEAAPAQASGVQPSGGKAPAAKPQDSAKATPPANGKDSEGKPKAEDPPKAAEGEDKGKLPEGVTQEAVVDFYKKLTGPIKADGKDVQIRSAEDAVRLMQMGINYSRRMHELKPLRAMNQMLQDNGLGDPEKLNFLIDLSKGKKEAIQKLLADHKIDPIDLDPAKSAEYKPAQHQPDPKDVAFKEAIEATIAQEGGRDLLADINASWDIESKHALKAQPLIFQNLLEQMQSGVYGKIKKELEYQRSLGYLGGVPFLQAYHQVGTAMQNAGVFNAPSPQKTQVQPMVPGPQNPAPIGTGIRKATAPKNAVPAPNLSSTAQPRVMTNQGHSASPTKSLSGLSDEEFMKLPPPR